jgi:hypothetical protein
MTPHGCQNELDWLAFAYVAGEMSAAAAEAFELRLAEEQPAREAVARAVELTLVVAAAERREELAVTIHRPATAWSTRLAWMAVGGVAALVLALVWNGAGGKADQAVDRPVASVPAISNGRELALAWSQTRAVLAESDLSESESGLWLPAHSAGGDLTEPASEDADEESLAEAPSWMTAGVFGLAGMSPEDAFAPDAFPRDEAPEPFSSERGDN